ncbi:hypothetical protein BUALT_Bualt16G0007100 [Buddleja alternifolia]|uniref:Glycosyltransferase n=1 Tax=Buddleja alternifolia TaxID=168488 RepID=A0AAV6W8L7_9LAMI|nr:hypothetical protein BUALT_Bualt16G0007100 [Buddleja alternifolia]
MGSTVHSDETLNSMHVFMVSFPAQGHVNPLLRLGKQLAYSGLFITLSAPESVGSKIRKANNITDDEPVRLGRGMIRFEFFNDGWEINDPKRHDLDAHMAQLELVGREKLKWMIRKQDEMGRRVSCIIINPFIPWVSDVAESLGIPSAMLWIQSCACFSAYYHFYHNLASFPSEKEPEFDVELPFMPSLRYDEVPSFLHPRTSYPFLRRALLGQFKNLSKPFCILMDTFQELEEGIIEYMEGLISTPIKTIGPLFKKEKNIISSQSIRVDFMAAENCIKWLDSKPLKSVVYISFGSIVHLKQEQIDEIAFGLLGSGVSFLWVLRSPHVVPLGFLEEVGDKGKIVQWSPQEEVLGHLSISCFVTHCGWNSTMEAVASGVPVVVFPQLGDQVTNAKFLVDVFRVGIRMCRGEDEGRVVPRDEVERCLRGATSSLEAARMKENAVKWKKAAEATVAEGGSSYKNMQSFVDEIVRIGIN